MTSAKGSGAYIALIKQTPAAPTVIPASPVLQKVDFTGEDLKRENKTSRNKHIRDDRMNNGLTIQGFNVGGGYKFLLTYENSLLDDILAGFLYAEEWSHIGASAEVDASGGVITLVGAELDMTVAAEKLTNIVDGQKIKLYGTANNGANDGIYALTETATDIYTMTPNPAADETLGSGVTARGSMIRNGSFYQPFYIERGHTDVTQYFKFIGMACNVLNLKFPDQGDVEGSYNFVGLNSKLEQAVESGATYTALTSNPVITTGNNTGRLSIDGVAQNGCYVKEHEFSLDNKVTPKTGQGVVSGACETNAHAIDLSSKMTIYFEDETMYDRFTSGTAFSFDWDVIDSNEHGYSFSLPSLQVEDDAVNVDSADSDVMDNISCVASVGQTIDCMIQIDKF